jgi:large subunit ribosomal protein L13
MWSPVPGQYPITSRDGPARAYVQPQAFRHHPHLVRDRRNRSHAWTSRNRGRGKHKPIFTPNIDTGDFIVIVNADKVYLEPNKAGKTFYHRHSGYPGGLRTFTQSERLATKPEEVIRQAVRGMLPKNTLGRQQLSKLKVYAGESHPHSAQGPKKLELPQAKRKPAA